MSGHRVTIWSFVLATALTLTASSARADTATCPTLAGPGGLFLPTGVGLVAGLPAFLNRNGSMELTGGLGTPSPRQEPPGHRPELDIAGSIDTDFGGWGYETRWSTQEFDACDYSYQHFSVAARFPLSRAERSTWRAAVGAQILLAAPGAGLGPSLSLVHDWNPPGLFLLTSRLSYYPSYAGTDSGRLITNHPLLARVRAAIPSDSWIQFTGALRGGLNRLVVPRPNADQTGFVHPTLAAMIGVRFQSVRR